MHLVDAAVATRAVAREVGDYEPVHGVQVAPGEEVIEPAFDEAYVFRRRYGAASLLIACRGTGQAASGLRWR